MSVGSMNTEASIDRVIEVFPMLVEKARRLSPA
jgi:cysteine sulfinate desulfinase/cysteine desulfurase-like protein